MRRQFRAIWHWLTDNKTESEQIEIGAEIGRYAIASIIAAFAAGLFFQLSDEYKNLTKSFLSVAILIFLIAFLPIIMRREAKKHGIRRRREAERKAQRRWNEEIEKSKNVRSKANHNSKS